MSDFSSQQIFIVTGASSGLGRGVALKLNELGASVVAVARNVERLESAKAQSVAPERFFCEIRDLAENINALPDYVKTLKEKYGKFRGLAYCAGIMKMRPVQLLDENEMKLVFDINYFAPMLMLKGFSDRRVNVGRGSSSVFISSISSFTSKRTMATYSGSKAALAASVKSVARELAPSGVRVNCISPSIVRTEMTENDGGIGIIAKRESEFPMGIGEVSDIANLATFLLSDRAKWITGQNYIADCASI